MFPMPQMLMMLGASHKGSGRQLSNFFKNESAPISQWGGAPESECESLNYFGSEVMKQTKASGKLLYDSLMKKCTEKERIFCSVHPEPSHPT